MREKLNDKHIYVASEETSLHINNDQWAEVAGLQSNQEEADTRIILHAAHAAEEGYRAVVVTPDDTDVMVLCLVFSPDISCPLFLKCRTKNRVRYIDINKLRHGLGYGVCDSLIGMPAYTVCETVSAFALFRRSWEARSVEANEIRALSGNVSRAEAVLGAIRGPIEETSSIHMQTVDAVSNNIR